MKRREFLQTTAALGAASALPVDALARSAADRGVRPACAPW
jgi:hypothetical protein